MNPIRGDGPSCPAIPPGVNHSAMKLLGSFVDNTNEAELQI